MSLMLWLHKAGDGTEARRAGVSKNETNHATIKQVIYLTRCRTRSPLSCAGLKSISNIAETLPAAVPKVVATAQRMAVLAESTLLISRVDLGLKPHQPARSLWRGKARGLTSSLPPALRHRPIRGLSTFAVMKAGAVRPTRMVGDRGVSVRDRVSLGVTSVGILGESEVPCCFSLHPPLSFSLQIPLKVRPWCTFLPSFCNGAGHICHGRVHQRPWQ